MLSTTSVSESIHMTLENSVIVQILSLVKACSFVMIDSQRSKMMRDQRRREGEGRWKQTPHRRDRDKARERNVLDLNDPSTELFEDVAGLGWEGFSVVETKEDEKVGHLRVDLSQ